MLIDVRRPNMRTLFVLVATLLAGAVKALPGGACVEASPPFLKQVDNETWIIGNGVWNMTQQRTFGVKLMYKEKDCVGEAVGHYVSYSMLRILWQQSWFIG